MLYTVFSRIVEEVIQKWRKLNNKEIHNFCSPLNVIMLIT